MELELDKPRLPLGQRAALISFSLIYGYVLQSLPFMAFLDRQSYLNYAEDSVLILARWISQGPLATLANEPLWLLTNIALGQFLEPEPTIRIIIFFSASLFAFVFTRANPKNAIWLVAFLLMPQLLKNHITHIRQGLAIAVFYFGYFSKRSLSRWVIMFAAPFIHASFLFIVPLVILPAVLERMRLAIDVRFVVFMMFAALSSASLGIVASVVGARQAGNYEFAMASVSGFGFVFWAMILALFVVEGKTFLKNHQFATGVLTFYLVSYFFVEVTARIFESGLALVLIAGLALTRWRQGAFIGGFLLYSTIQWALRLASETPF